MMNRCITASLLLMLSHAAWAQNLPARKPGLWEVTLQEKSSSVMAAQKALQCTDKASDAQMLMSVVPGQEECRAPVVQKSGNRYRIRTVCFVHGTRVDTTMQLTGDLASKYQGEFGTRYAATNIPQPKPQQFEGRWMGACTAGMKPGDMVLPNGITVNVLKKPSTGKEHDHDHSAPGHKH